MDSGTIVISAILVAVCFMPFALIGINRKKKKNTMVQALKHVAELQHCKINTFEICGEIAVGFAETENAFIFLKKSANHEVSKVIRLSEVKNCIPIHTGKTVKSKSGNYTVIEQLAMQISYINSNKVDDLLEFYNLNGNLQLDGELQLLEKWTNIIEVNLKKMPIKYHLAQAV